MKRHQYALITVALLSATAFSVFGGWAIVTVDDMPEHFVVGQPTELSFIVRQHAVSPLADLTPRVTLRSGSNSASAAVKAGARRGHYIATLIAPRAGEWTTRIESGFGNAETSMLPTKAIAAGTAAPVISEAERGHRLFYAKGCVTCHVRGGEGTTYSLKIGPELTGRTFPEEAMAKFLKDPSANPMRTIPTGQMRMPQFELKDREIASLVAYINSTRQLSSK